MEINRVHADKKQVNSSPKFNGKCYSVIKLSTWQGTGKGLSLFTMFVKLMGELAILLFAVDTSKDQATTPRTFSHNTPKGGSGIKFALSPSNSILMKENIPSMSSLLPLVKYLRQLNCVMLQHVFLISLRECSCLELM